MPRAWKVVAAQSRAIEVTLRGVTRDRLRGAEPEHSQLQRGGVETEKVFERMPSQVMANGVNSSAERYRSRSIRYSHALRNHAGARR
jgi:hypothetical protein